MKNKYDPITSISSKNNKENKQSNLPKDSNPKEIEQNSSTSSPIALEPNYQYIKEESSSNNKDSYNIQEESMDIIRNLQNNSERTEIKKSESCSTHLDKKEDNNIKKKKFAKNKNKKSPNLTVKDKIDEESEENEDKNENSVNNSYEDKKENNSSSSLKNLYNSIENNQVSNINNDNTIKDQKNKFQEKDSNLFNNKDISNQNVENEGNNKNEINKNENQKINEINDNINVYGQNLEQNAIKLSVQKVKVKASNFEDKGNFEKIKEISDNQFNKQIYNKKFYEEYEQSIDEKINKGIFNNDNDNLNYKDIQGNFEAIQNIFEQKEYNNNFLQEIEQLCDRNLDILSLYNNFFEDKPNFEEIEYCSNNQFNPKLILENSFISEYDKLSDKENIG